MIAPLAASVNAFHIIGGVLALWAVIVAALGIMRPKFPFSDGGARIVGGLTAVLVVAVLVSAVATAEHTPAAHGGETGQEPDTGEEAHGGEEAPPAGEQPAPGQETPAGGGEAPAGGGEALELTADETGQLKFDKTELQAAAGTVEIVMTNPSPVPHDVAIEGSGVDEKGEVVQKDGQSRVSADLEAGEYTFYCSVPGHRDAGMEGKLVVR